MKNSNFRANIFSSVAGIILGLAMLLSFGFAQPATAGDYCPDPGGCPGGYCFTRGDGQKSCKYFGTPSGCTATCKSNSYPYSDFETETGPTN